VGITGEDPALPEPATESNRRRILARVIGAIGEGMVTLGILVGLFVVWEMWWTDIAGTHHQHEIVANLDWGLPVIPVPITPTTAPSESPDEDGPAYDVIQPDQMEFEREPPVEATPVRAETFATMYVPRWGEDYVRPISEGVNRRDVLDKLGIGHYRDTALPGGWGNFAVAAHRTTFGKPFERIEELMPGDAIVVRTESTWYVYRVTETHVVKPSFAAAIAPVPGNSGASANDRYITLTTCHPRLSASKRYVVYGVLEYWAPASTGYPPEIVPGESGTSEATEDVVEEVTA
jgi:sortase A